MLSFEWRITHRGISIELFPRLSLCYIDIYIDIYIYIVRTWLPNSDNEFSSRKKKRREEKKIIKKKRRKGHSIPPTFRPLSIASIAAQIYNESFLAKTVGPRRVSRRILYPSSGPRGDSIFPIKVFFLE